MVATNFDAKQHEPNRGFEPIPAGWYVAMIDESSKVETKAKDGHYLKFRFRIVKGDHAKRVIFTNLNLWNKNPVAVEIANSDLSAICHATGVMKLDDTQQLHGRPIKIKLRIKAADGNYEAGNEISGYEAVEGGGADSVPAFAKEQTQEKEEVKEPWAEEEEPDSYEGSEQPSETPPWAREE